MGYGKIQRISLRAADDSHMNVQQGKVDSSPRLSLNPFSMTWEALSGRMWRHRWAIGLFVTVAIGIVFRLIWLEDMEYKGDEAWTFTHVQAFWQTRHLPLIGLPSTTALPNAAMYFSVFL